MSISENSQINNQLSKTQRILILLSIGIAVFSFQFVLFYLFQIVFPLIAILGLISIIMAVLVLFSKENKTNVAVVSTPRQINMQIILTSMFFLVVGFILLYISQFLNDWRFTKIGKTSEISIYEISLIWIFVSFVMTIFFSIKHIFIKK